MTGRVNVTTFDRMCAERNLTVRKLHELSGIAMSTLARVRRGDPVSTQTVETIWGTFKGIAVEPGLAELLAS